MKLAFLSHLPKFADLAAEDRQPVEQAAGEGPPLEDFGMGGGDGPGNGRPPEDDELAEEA